MEHEDLKRVDTNQYKIKTAYYSAGSGIPEVKVILGGFVIKGFLGIKTLIVKSIGMVNFDFESEKQPMSHHHLFPFFVRFSPLRPV